MIYNPHAFGGGGLSQAQILQQQQQQQQNFINQNSNAGNYQIPANTGILMQQLGMTPNQPVLTSPTVTPAAVVNTNVQPRRDAVAMAVPRPQVPLSEKLMRVGGAIVGASERGGLAAFNAGTAEYGSIMDDQRKMDTVYNSDINDRVAASAAANQEALEANMEAIGMYQQSLGDFAKAKAHLREGGITGFIDNTFGRLKDNITGDPKAAGRLLLDKLKVDDALMRIAQTKGAISNKEMDLFLKPAPSNFQDEKVWLDWISEKEKALGAVLYRLQNNVRVKSGMQPTSKSFQQFSNQYNIGTTGTAPLQTGQTQNISVGGQTVPVKKID